MGVILVLSVLPPALLGACRPPLSFVGPGQIRAWRQRTLKGHKVLAPPLINRQSVLSPFLAALRYGASDITVTILLAIFCKFSTKEFTVSILSLQTLSVLPAPGLAASGPFCDNG